MGRLAFNGSDHLAPAHLDWKVQHPNPGTNSETEGTSGAAGEHLAMGKADGMV
jgi:hypothetical protein